MDTEIFIVHAKTEYICKDIAKDIETRFNTSNIDLDRPFPKRTNHKWTNHKKKIVGLRAQTHSYLKDNNDKDKRQKALKKNEKKFEDERNCVEAVQVENKIDLQKKNKIGADGPKEDHKEFIKSNEFILKTRRRFKIEKHNIFINEINKNALSSNNDERMQSIDLMETYAHGSSKDLVCKKENTKCSNIIKQYKNI